MSKTAKKTKDSRQITDSTNIEFLPDADEIERTPLPRTLRFVLYIFVTAFVGFLGWAVLSEVDKVVVARGKLVTTTAKIIVQPLETSIIQSLNVRQGQVVRKGEALASLDSTFAEADKEQLRTRLKSLETQALELEAELTGSDVMDKSSVSSDSKLQTLLSAERVANFHSQLSKMEAAADKTRSALKTNLRDQQVLANRVQVLREMENMQEKMVAQQSGARVDLLEARERRLQADREVQLAKSKERELKNELASVLSEKEAFRKSWRQDAMEELLSITRERDGLREQLEKADKRRNMVVLRSPSDAVVLQVAKLSQGSVVSSAETLFILVPLGSQLEAEVEIDSIDVGYVKVGNNVRLKFDAFPFQKHGTVEGKLRTLSEDAFQRESVAGQGSSTYYMSRIRLEKGQQLRNMSPEGRLLPGMTLSAEIVVGKRSVISYLIWPLTKSFDDSAQPTKSKPIEKVAADFLEEAVSLFKQLTEYLNELRNRG